MQLEIGNELKSTLETTHRLDDSAGQHVEGLLARIRMYGELDQSLLRLPDLRGASTIGVAREKFYLRDQEVVGLRLGEDQARLQVEIVLAGGKHQSLVSASGLDAIAIRVGDQQLKAPKEVEQLTRAFIKHLGTLLD